jgi:phosphoglycerol transferase MdoB-like AlkP superfamily enzyme
LYGVLAPRAYSVIIFAALFCTLAVKFFHSCRTNLVSEYFSWILADLVVLFSLELILALLCFLWPRKAVVRTAILTAAIVCTWSVINAGWLIATGTQVLPAVLLSLIGDPINRFAIVGHHLILQPIVAVALLGPSAIALTFLFMVLANPLPPKHNSKTFLQRIIIYALTVIAVVSVSSAKARNTSEGIVSQSLRYNCQLKVLTSLFSHSSDQMANHDYSDATRKIPTFDEIDISLIAGVPKSPHNVVIVILEGVTYKHTSLYDDSHNLTPYLATLARQGVVFTNSRTPFTHSTKAFFSILTGRFPSLSQDYVEAIPALKPYAGIATILEEKLNFRTAFFQSAKGNFEARPGLVYNLGFDKFWARDDLNDPNTYLGYLASDEFAMLKPIADWIKADERPFLLVVLCSATHDPYEVPQWFGDNQGEPIERYRRTLAYTDSFIKTLDAELGKLGCAENTIFCVTGDHGEAFGEHGRLGHDRIPFDEVLRIVWLLRAPGLIEAGRQVTEPAFSVDVTPTVLSLLGFDIDTAGFNGINPLQSHRQRKLYFSSWIRRGPAGYVRGNEKFIYDPTNRMVVVYDLQEDPRESKGKEIEGRQAENVIAEVTEWQKKNVIPLIDWGQTKEIVLFDFWRIYRLKCREPSAKYINQ